MKFWLFFVNGRAVVNEHYTIDEVRTVSAGLLKGFGMRCDSPPTVSVWKVLGNWHKASGCFHQQRQICLFVVY